MRHFTTAELSKSDTARRKGIDNTPTAVAESNIRGLVDNVLDPLRSAWGRPVVVNSGYRSPELNKAVGGAPGSQHLTGEAADIEDASRGREENKKLFELIIQLGLPFDQLINEFDYNWIHVSFCRTRRRGQVLKSKRVGGKTVYTVLKPPFAKTSILPAALLPLLPLLPLLGGCGTSRIVSGSSERREVEYRTQYIERVDTAYVELPVVSERTATRDTLSRLENDYALSVAEIRRGGVLFHSLETKPARRPVPVIAKEAVRDSVVYRDREVKVETPVEVACPLSSFVKAQIIGFWALFAALAVWICTKIKKFV